MACDTLVDAGERALSLALGPEAQRAFERAAELAEDDRRARTLLDKAGRAAHLNADFPAARERFEQAVELFESLGDHGPCRARSPDYRKEEAIALRRHALALALEHEFTDQALRNYNNLADVPLQLDQFPEAVAVAEPGLALAKTRGYRRWEQVLSLLIATANVARGQWDELRLAEGDALPWSGLNLLAHLPLLARIQSARGDTAGLRRLLTLAGEHVGSSNVEYAASPILASAIVLRALGRDEEALKAALPIAIGSLAIPNEDRREAYVEAGLAALKLGDDDAVTQLIEFVANLPPVKRTPLLRAGAARFAGLLAARHGDTNTAGERLEQATGELREIDAPFVLAQVLLEHAELLHAGGRDVDATPLLTEATQIFTRLRATPYLERAASLGAGVTA